MYKKSNKFLLLLLIGMMFLISCNQDKGVEKGIEVVNLYEDGFLVLKDSEVFKSGDVVILNSEEEFKVGEIYKVLTDDKITKSLPPIANAEEIKLLGSHSSNKISFEDGDNIMNYFPEKTHLVDVRTAEEFSNGHVPGAINISVDDIEKDLVGSFDKEDIFILYCRSGNRSATAAKILVENGYNLVFDAGGIGSYKGELE